MNATDTLSPPTTDIQPPSVKRTLDMTPEAIRALRHRLGLGQTKFARLIGMATAGGISRLENGSRQAKGSCLAALRMAALLTPGKARRILRYLNKHR